MTQIRYTALPTETVQALRNGAPDAYGTPPERAVSDGEGNPCRHCLRDVPAGADMLILAHRPFAHLHPYAETGPIFLCADACERGGGADTPDILTTSPDYLIKGYSANERIVYGTGAVVPRDSLATRAKAIFEDPCVAWIHVRSARNNCYQLRIDRT
ncbi:DUF1203 domain-containing protein [Sulfitobacter sp. D35]|uniref:DUF1203 domain-containing protein n=1 Tax=Sulfitobacter sp. D35 TaxID=3083252 RepID=UPI00296E35D3|nr:DUF1203 domain-containing protein [Sulfitobacter sp. D35]MDW4498282.1 DUF1203 domain-containing protein [Sulfitobacter sp. D35]